MKTYLALFAEGFVLAYVLTPILIAICERFGFVDRPDGVRKLHANPVASLGGMVIAVSAGISIMSLAVMPNEPGNLLRANQDRLGPIILPCLLMLAVGVIDDVRPLRAREKLVAQLLAATLLWLSGVTFGMGYLQTHGYLASRAATYFLTVFWVVGITNAVNLIDGLDGLAAGVSAMVCLTMAISGLTLDTPLVALIMLPVSGALMGFLRYNFAPARIFLGDSGTLPLGFSMAAMSLIYTQKKAAIVAIAVPLLALGLPVFDTLLSITRRFIGGTPLFAGDRGHIHHRLLHLGLLPRHVVAVLYGVTFLCCSLSVALLFAEQLAATLIIAAFALMAAVGVRALRYLELRVTRAVLTPQAPSKSGQEWKG